MAKLEDITVGCNIRIAGGEAMQVIALQQGGRQRLK